MASKMLPFLALHVVTWCVTQAAVLPDTSYTYKRVFRIPNKIFDGRAELYCSGQTIVANQYFVGFKMLVDTPDTIHHISIDICDEAYSTDYIWDCTKGRICKAGTPHRIGVFTWGRESNGWNLPEGVGVAIGNTSKAVILQVHSATIFKPTDLAESGVEVTFSSKTPEFHAGIAILGNVGRIPPNVKDYPTDSACEWTFNETVSIMSYSIHTHSHGKAVVAYLIRNGRWMEIGRGNPFYPEVVMDIAYKELEIRPGDIVAARCTYTIDEDRYVEFGHRAVDEMCNIHLHYAYPSNGYQGLKHVECGADGETFHWSDYLEGIPANTGDSYSPDQQAYVKKNHWTKHAYKTM